jgi:bacillithiol system protein YtxJ
MDWIKLENLDQLAEAKAKSTEKPVMIFKHSTRCSISSMALNRIVRSWKPEDREKVIPYLLDLISFREISDQISREFGVFHQSPQVILIKNGQAIYDASHMGINFQDILTRS